MPRGVYPRTLEIKANMKGHSGVYDHYKQRKPKETRTCAADSCDVTFEVIINGSNYGRKYCYWGCWMKSVRGKPRSKEVGEKISKSKEGVIFSEEHKSALRQAQLRLYASGYVNPMKGTHCPGPKNNNWRGGISKLPYPFEFNEEFKNLIRERDNNTCQLCGKTGEEEGRTLCVHHINYDKDDLFELNFITLCRSCNNKVNFNRGMWEDYFMYIVYGG